MLPHAPEERLNVVDRGGANEVAIIEHEAYPEVVHEDGEAGHDGNDAPWTAELIPFGVRSTGGEDEEVGNAHSVCLSSCLSRSMPSFVGRTTRLTARWLGLRCLISPPGIVRSM